MLVFKFTDFHSKGANRVRQLVFQALDLQAKLGFHFKLGGVRHGSLLITHLGQAVDALYLGYAGLHIAIKRLKSLLAEGVAILGVIVSNCNRCLQVADLILEILEYFGLGTVKTDCILNLGQPLVHSVLLRVQLCDLPSVHISLLNDGLDQLGNCVPCARLQRKQIELMGRLVLFFIRECHCFFAHGAADCARKLSHFHRKLFLVCEALRTLGYRHTSLYL